MTQLQIIVVSALVPFLLGAVWVMSKNGYRLFRTKILHRDIAYKVLVHTFHEKACETRIKIAYAGRDKEIIREILFTYRLRLPAFIDRFLANIHIATAYLTCDMRGLTTLLGTEYYRTAPLMVHIWKAPRVIKYPISVVNGIFFFYVTFLMLVIPVVGWIFLNLGPYGKFSLDSVSHSVTITDENGRAVQLPIVLSPGAELIWNVNCKLGLNAKGFRMDAPYKILDDFPARSFRTPKPGYFAWVGSGSIHLCLGDKWNRLPTELDKRVTIGIGSN